MKNPTTPATQTQKAIIYNNRDRWFYMFDGSTKYDTYDGPSDEQIENLTQEEAGIIISAMITNVK